MKRMDAKMIELDQINKQIYQCFLQYRKELSPQNHEIKNKELFAIKHKIYADIGLLIDEKQERKSKYFM